LDDLTIFFTARLCKTGRVDLSPGNEEEALAQPTRSRIFGYLVKRRRAASTLEIAQAVGLHPNGVRRHLGRLAAAGLLERRQTHGGRGRPGDRWVVAASARPGGGRPRAYTDLARWLARAIPATAGRESEVERTGREIGRELAPTEAGDPVESFEAAIAALGFQPALDIEGDGSFSCRLANCPYRDSARENAAIVCVLHRGLTAGLLSKLMPDAKLVRFEPRDPDRAGCTVGVDRSGR
jgi:predicted ArsR family transcriptional regulator